MNEDQYYNPIIQAMIHTATLQKQGAQQEIEKQKNKEEADARKEQLKQAQQVLEYTKAHQERSDEADRMRAQADVLQRQAATALQLQAAYHQGGSPQAMMGAIGHLIGPHISEALSRNPNLPNPTPDVQQLGQPNQIPQTLPQPPGALPDFTQQSEESTYGSPTKAAGIAAEAAGLKAKAEAEGKLPSEQALAKTHFDFNKQLQDAAHLNTKEIAEMSKSTQYDIAKMSKATQLAIANMDNKTRLQIAGMGGDENSQNLVNSLKMGLATGEIKLNPTNRLHQIAYGQLQDNDWKAVDPVDIKEAKGMQNIEPLLGKLRTLAAKLPDNPVDEAITRGKEAVKNVFITSKLRNEINIINSQIMNVARNTEGVTGRPLAAAMKPELDSLASVTSKSNMEDRINNLEGNYVNKFNNVIFAGMSPEQRELVNQKHGLKPVSSSTNLPDFLKLAPPKSSSGHSLDIEESIRRGVPAYK